ncbi:MAG: M24 family metallopeptidase [Massilia sp.]
MRPALAAGAAEVAVKLGALRQFLAAHGGGALRLRGSDWFAWVTAGGANTVLLASDTGVAEVLVTRAEACILTDEIEAERLKAEQVPPGFTFHVAPWTDTDLHDAFVLGEAGGAPVLSDHPGPGELPLPGGARQLRLRMSAPEQARYRALGLDAACAASEVMRKARPDWTEYALAGAGAEALWRRGIEPALVLAAGERRVQQYRHPTPSDAPLGRQAMLVLCARRHGLVANLTRFVCFCQPPLRQSEMKQVEATGLAACVPGNSLSAVYHALVQAYHHAGQPAAIREHHQGGVTGYRARELVATPSTALQLESGMAVAFNPSFQGIKIEDTFLIGEHGLENLTCDPDWPALAVQGRMRPLWLEVTW